MNEKDFNQEKLKRLAEAGITISFVYGQAGDKGIMWSVNCLTFDQMEFEKPFAGKDFQHCCQIVYSECLKRGWI
jgi:hypothetical protein